MATSTTPLQRLCHETHVLAEEGLRGAWGKTLVDLPLTLDDRADLQGASDEQRYAACVQMIAEQAPVRIIPGQRLVGSATLYKASTHVVPVYAAGKPAYESTSHVTLGFPKALRVGLKGLRAEVEARLAQGDLDDKGRDFLQACLTCLDAAHTWHARYMAELRSLAAGAADSTERTHWEGVRAALARVPDEPPATFREAVQALWFLFAFQRLCGNWPGVGRIDEVLGPYLARDLQAGLTTLDEARELIAHFWIAGLDWAGTPPWHDGSGDGEFYQNIILAGVDAAGQSVINDVTYLVLDVVEELRISDFPIAVRISPETPAALLRRVAEVQRLGGGIVAVYDEPLIIRSLTSFGYPLEEARTFANDGCWELQVPGKTHFIYRPFDCLAVLQRTLGMLRPEGAWCWAVADEVPDYPTFGALYDAFYRALAEQVDALHREADHHAANGRPSTLVSLLTEDCIQRARGYNDRGARYNAFAPHAGGLADVANSLLALKKLVYDERQMTLPNLVAVLRRDWAGEEPLRREILARYPAYGNDQPEADAMTKRVLDDFIALVSAVHERNGVLRPAGLSTFGREIEWRAHRQASPHGHHAADILATNFSPTPGSDRQGPTAVIKSHCAMDLVRLANGTALELKMDPSAVAGEDGIQCLVGLMRAFVDLGGIFMHIDVVDNNILRLAQQFPERYSTLAVRVSGWSARFVTLGKDWQEMIINRTLQHV